MPPPSSVPSPLTPPPVGRNALVAVVISAAIGIAAALGYYTAPSCPPCAAPAQAQPSQ